MEGQGLAAFREPNAEGVRVSCGWPTLSGCSKAAPAPQQGSCFAIESERRNDQAPPGAVLLLCWQELSPGSVCCTVEGVSQKEFGTFRADVVDIKLAAGALGYAWSCSQGGGVHSQAVHSSCELYQSL